MKTNEATKSIAETTEKVETTETTEKKVMTLSIEDLSKVNGGRAAQELRQQGLIDWQS